MADHKLHTAVYRALKAAHIDSIHADPACSMNREEHVQLFLDKNGGRENHFCNVDILILNKNKDVSAIIEIEESDITPIKIFGKFLASALSSFYIQKSGKNKHAIGTGAVLFLQVIDSSGLPRPTKRIKLWENIEKKIKEINISKMKYKMLIGNPTDFENGKEKYNSLVALLNGHLS